MQQQRIRRVLDTKSMIGQDNQVLTFDLGRNYDVEAYLVRAAFTMNVTTTGAAVRAESPFGIVRQFTLQAEGRTTMISVPGTILGTAPFQSRNAGLRTPPPGFGVAAHVCAAEWIIPRAVIDGIRSKDANFRTEALNILQLRAQLGNVTDLLTGTPVGTITAGTMAVAEIGLQELADPTTKKRSVPQYMQKWTSADYPISASSTSFQIPLPVGNYLRACIFRAGLSGEGSDAVINNIRIARGQDVRFDLPYLLTRQANRHDYNITLPAGYAIADLGYAGALQGSKASDAWNLRGGAETKAILDVTTGTNAVVNVTTCELVKL